MPQETTQTADITVNPQGSVVAFTVETDAARDWVNENVHTEDWQWLGEDTLAVDHRFAMTLIEGAHEAGLTLAMA